MKSKLIFLFLAFLLIIPMASSLDFDNVKRYDSGKKEVVIENAFGFGEVIARVKLTSELNVNVLAGKDRKVAELHFIDFDQNYNSALRKMEFINQKDKKEINRAFTYKYKVQTRTKTIPIYEDVCTEPLVCTRTQIGTRTEPVYEWVPFTKINELPNQNITVGIFTDVEIGDYVDWIPTLFGVRIDEWATWTEGLNNQILSYYKLNETSGDMLDSVTAHYNGTLQAGVTQGTTGKIGNAYSFDGGGSAYVSVQNTPSPCIDLNCTFSFWMQYSQAGNDNFYSESDGGNPHSVAFGTNVVAGGIYVQIRDSTSQTFSSTSTGMNNGEWQLVTYVLNKTSVAIYINGTLDGQTAITKNPTDPVTINALGSAQTTGTDTYQGVLDEVGFWNRALTASEVSDLWNNGDGITYGLPAPEQPLSINLSIPANNTFTDSSIVIFNWSISNVNPLSNTTLVINGIPNVTITDNSINGSYQQSLSMADGQYNWTAEAWDNASQQAITENRTLTVDTTDPIVSITSPAGTYNYIYNNYTFNLNTTATDTNLEDVWYEYNGINTSIPGALSGVLNSLDFNYTIGSNSITVWANDTLGHLASSTSTINFKIIENSQTFQTPVVVGSLQDYSLNITLDSGVGLTSGQFHWGSEENVTSSISTSGNNRILSITNFEIPSFDNSTNVSFNWVLSLNDSSTITTANQTQLVNVIGLDNCTSFSNELFNLSLFKERSRTPLNGTIELNYDVLVKPYYNQIQTLSTIYEDISNTMVCSENNLTGQDLAYSVEIKYYSDDYESELYNIHRADIDGEVGNINLYDLNSNYSTEFKLIYQDNNFEYVENAIIQLQRKYIPSNVYEIVEAPLTSADGTTVAHIDLDSNKYRVTVLKDGEVIDNFDNLVFLCENALIGSCTQSLIGKVNPNNIVDLGNTLDFSYSEPTVINQTISVSYSVPSGQPATIGISLTQRDQFGNETLCNQDVVSSSGAIDCDFTETIGDSFIDLEITKDNQLMVKKSYVIHPSSDYGFLGNNFFIVVLFLLSIVGMAFTSPEWIIINAVLTFVIGGSLWLLEGLDFVVGLGGLVWLVIGAGILIFKIAKQEDR